jgi:Rieske Fe-S protein
MRLESRSAVPATRRRVLGGCAAVGLTCLAAACAAGDPPSGTGSPPGGTTGGSAPGATGAPAALPATTLAASEVPVGGGVILAEEAVVVTQPVRGKFKAFSAVCPHLGCLVSDVSASAITCACHGSQFSPANGSVLTGPATDGLAVLTVSMSGGMLTIS